MKKLNIAKLFLLATVVGSVLFFASCGEPESESTLPLPITTKTSVTKSLNQPITLNPLRITHNPSLCRSKSPIVSPEDSRPVADSGVSPNVGDGTVLCSQVISFAKRGIRLTMEDEVDTDCSPEKTYIFAAVYDGHGGDEVAKYLKQNLKEKILQNIRVGTFKENISAAFLEVDKMIHQVDAHIEDGAGYVGSCATTVFIDKRTRIAYFANLGDSRTILITENGGVHFSTKDHKPNNPEEQARIEGAGGCVFSNRVNGNLAVSRAFGDYFFKPVQGDGTIDINKYLVSPIPNVTAVQLQPTDKFIVLACDGIWDVFRNEEVAQFVLAQSQAGSKNIAKDLVDKALSREKHSTDNCSAIVISLDIH